MMLLNAVEISNLVQFIKVRKLNIFVESMQKNVVELLLRIEYKDIDEFQDLLTEDYLENYGIFGEAHDGYLSINISPVIACMELKIEDFKDYIDEDDWQLYEKWLERQNAKSA